MRQSFAWAAVAATLAIAIPASADEHVGRDAEHVGRDAERGDPHRWYEPITTPRQRYENRMQEARNALAESVKECRREPRPERRRCESEARAEYEREAAQAKAERARGA